ncbi:MAG TPA: GAF domain-containing protein, partial [Candidatus Methylomirabilis sp.]|nr:GAF domain-containing protein [Candidatus Methylomirabilis sp.]
MRLVRLPSADRKLIRASYIDITERQRAGEALREAEERYRRFVQMSAEGVWRLDFAPPVPVSLDEREQAELILHRARLGECNDTLARGLGYEKAVDMLEAWVSLDDVMGGPQEEKPGAIREFIRSGYRITNLEIPNRDRDGKRVWTLNNIVGIVEGGYLTCAWGISRDITERKRGEEALGERTRQLEAVRVVGEEITREMRFPTLLELIVERAVRLIGGTGGCVMLWDESRSVLIPRVWVGRAPASREASHIALEEGVSGTVAAQRKGMIVNDYRRSPWARPVMLERTNITAAISEPLVYQDRLVGVIQLDDGGTGHRFSEQDQELLRLFATQAAIAIENARLYEATQQELADRVRAEKTVAARTRQLEAVRVVSEEITRELDLTRLLDLIHRRAAGLVEASRGVISLWEEESQTLVTRAWHGYGTWVREVRPHLGEGVVGLVAQRREGLIV